MDHTLTLPSQTPQAQASAPVCGVSVPPLGPASDEDPESPGRSPRQGPAAGSFGDPLAEGMAQLAGIVLALIAVLVPLALVLSESRSPRLQPDRAAGLTPLADPWAESSS